MFGSGRGWWVMLTYDMENDAVTGWHGGGSVLMSCRCPCELTQCKALYRCAAPVCNASVASSTACAAKQGEVADGRTDMQGRGVKPGDAAREEGKRLQAELLGIVDPIQTVASGLQACSSRRQDAGRWWKEVEV